LELRRREWPSITGGTYRTSRLIMFLTWVDGWPTAIVDKNCAAALNGTHQLSFLLMMVTYWMEA